MDIWKKYKSPLGYYSNDNQIDSYGVDHSGFTTQDELNYQLTRAERENNLIEQFKNQGLKNYPQYGTNFWGNSADNNYGFGISNIDPHIERIKNLLAKNNYTSSQNEAYIFSPEMRELLGQKESEGNYAKYNQEGGGIGALGKYQLRGPGLQDIGYVKKDSNGKYHWLGKNNIWSAQDFYDNPELQESALDEFMKVQQRYLKHYGSWSNIGTPIHGVVSDFNISDTAVSYTHLTLPTKLEV